MVQLTWNTMYTCVCVHTYKKGGERVDRRWPRCTNGGNQSGAITMENKVAVSQKIKNRITM